MIALLLAAAAQAPVVLDSFDAPAAWVAQGSDGVTAQATPAGGALRLSYDFAQVSGYAFVARALAVDWGDDYVLTLRVRGSGGVNDLQVKFTDADGSNVWWYVRPNFRVTAEWQTLRIRARDMIFAWGPAADHRLRRTARMEVVVVRGRDGGAGTLELDELTYTPLPPPSPLPAPRAGDAAVLDGDPATIWRGRAGRSVAIDFGGTKALGGVVLDWQGAAPRYAVEASDDGRRWRVVRRVDQGDGGTDPIALPGLETRWLRVALPKEAAAARLVEIRVQPPEWGATPNALVTALAKAAPRGTFPRGFTEQSYWTLVGPDGGPASGLIGEDGAIEVTKGAFSIEPFVVVDGKRVGWADVTPAQSLEDGYLPLPHVAWAAPGWTLDTALFADTTAPRLMARWRLTNTGETRRTLRLALAVRPFQVNPPAQFLSQPGGVSPIGRIAWTDGRLRVTTPPAVEGDAAVTRLVQPLVAPDAIGVRAFDRGALGDPPAVGGIAVADGTGLASATLAWDFDLAPGESADVPVAIPFVADAPTVDRAGFVAAHDATVASWREKLGGIVLTVPHAHRAVADTLRTALAHVLMSRDGAALKPGTRSYDRSWIRDGAMMSDTLLRLGVVEPARAFADWYGTKLFANGKVPCCVDARGADPVPENDSHGEYIHLVTQLYRFTGDRAALARDWPRIDAARRYMEGLRQSERTPANLTPERRMLYGLMPPSISHEGYSAKAQYSLWDDFWALTGYKDAAFAARALGTPEATTIAGQRDRFATDLHAAIEESRRYWKIDYIPGATSLGDFDATSTTMALDPAGEQGALDRKALAATFERQWQRVMARRAPGADWADYTPYELRNVSAFVRLGWRARANALLDFYMADRRPAAWNGWAEVVGRLPRETRFIGDMPHAWVASDFIRAALDLFAYEQGDVIVLGGGLDSTWLAGGGAAVRGVRTTAGTLDFAMRQDGGGIVATIGGTARPAGGFVLAWPLAGVPGVAMVDGRRVRVGADGLRIAPTGQPIEVVWRGR